MRLVFRSILIAVSATLAAVALYVTFAFVLGIIPLNTEYEAAEPGIDVFVVSNGVHADLVLPRSAAGVDWPSQLPPDTMRFGEEPGGYLAFGWGDRGFYLATPQWSDLQFTTAVVALSGLDAAVLHVEPIHAVPNAGPQTRHVSLTPQAYRRLAAFVRASFALDERGETIMIPHAHYGPDDVFFEARGRYLLFVTCNEWTRRALAEAGVRVPVWSPFERALLFQLPATG